MKKFTRRIIAFHVLCFLSFGIILPQNTLAQRKCGTMEHLEMQMKRDPSLKGRMEADEARLNQLMLQKIQARMNGTPGARLNNTVYIPVVVHLVLPDPSIVTDADVIWQINKMNEDFAGLNADSAMAGPFASLFGHSQIQFCLAQQDANGNPSNGIHRVSSSATFDMNTSDNLKSETTCGTTSWDVNRFFNIWVGVATDGTLGVATFPNMTPAVNQGIVIGIEGFSNNAAYVAPEFNLGRTAVHEAGHFFYLRHIWGDGGGCQSDFPSVAGLPNFADDTPTQSGATSGCPSGQQAAGCGSPNPPGKMYQNYMDYTNDACYCMFTLNQVARMESALDLFRNSLMTSDACTPATVFTNDAALSAILSPVGGTCGQAANNTLCDPIVVPQVTIKNIGSATLTSLNIYTQVDNGTPVATPWAGNLATNASATVTLSSITATSGTHTLKIYVADPNGAADGRTVNDTLTTSFTILEPITGPITEGFESTTFPPAGWQLINPNSGSLTWQRTTAAKKSGNASAIMRFYDYDGGSLHEDILLSPTLDVTTADSVLLSFERAYRRYSTSATYADTLAIVISSDCGNTFTEVWKKGGADLATVAGTTTSGFVPSAASDWLNEKINLKPFIGTATSIAVGFKSINKYGQNLYLDDINIETVEVDDNIVSAGITRITEPAGRLCEERSVTPAVELINSGIADLQSVTVVLKINNTIADSVEWTGNLAPGASVIVSANTLTLPAGNNHILIAYTKTPNGVTDMILTDDTVSMHVVTHDAVQAPVEESFESNSFPPENWSVESSGSNYTWQKTNRAATVNSASAWIRNYRFNSMGEADDLYSPIVQLAAADSAYITFDLANATGQYPGTTTLPLDTLEVLLTTDCGATFQTVYKKWGAALQTTGNPNFPTTYPASDTVGFVPAPNHWRNESINISRFAPSNSKFQVVFRMKNNKGNNTFIDNVKIYSIELPARLKSAGYLVMPNPFDQYFEIKHLLPPVTLKGIEVATAAGQVLFRRQYQGGNASSYIRIDMTPYSSGMYNVRMIYSDKVVTEKVIKR